ncbi:hypothetical protein GCM10025777_12350 [Membranihabitans marinus]
MSLFGKKLIMLHKNKDKNSKPKKEPVKQRPQVTMPETKPDTRNINETNITKR